MGLNYVGEETFEAYQIKIKTIVSQLLGGEKHLVIWGSGENGNRFMRYCAAIHVPVRCFVDNNPALWGTERWDIPIISPAELGGMEAAVVLISFPSAKVVQEVAAQIEGAPHGGVSAKPCFDDSLFYLLQNTACGREETAVEVITSMYQAVHDGEYLHMPILSPNLVTTRCNLKCRDCILRIPYLKEHKDADTNAIWADLDRTLEIVDSIKTLEVCGGETFLCRDLVSFLNKAKEYKRIMNICVIMNGTIVPEDLVFDAMKNCNVVLKISNYGSISNKISALEKKCEEKDIPCFVQDCSWFDLSPKKDLNYTPKELQELFDGCSIKDCCIRNWDGIIYRCGFQRVWGDAGLVDDVERIKQDGIDLNDRSDDQALKKRLKEYLTTTVPFEICKYCRGNTAPIPRAIQL